MKINLNGNDSKIVKKNKVGDLTNQSIEDAKEDLKKQKKELKNRDLK